MVLDKEAIAKLQQIKDRLPESSEPSLISKLSTSKKKVQTTKGKCLPSCRVPLQVLKLDDFDISQYDQHGKIGQRVNYQHFFQWQEDLDSLLAIVLLANRLKEISLLLQDKPDRELKKILERIQRNSSSNQLNINCIKDEISKLDDQRIRIVLESAAASDSQLHILYKTLVERVEFLACNILDKSGHLQKAIVVADFPWRTRVGGIRGFRERLLPALHPTYGVPYIPASSIKGLVRSWAKNEGQKSEEEIKELLGYLKGSNGSMAKVEFLDAFPTSPSLDLDVATPQWKWQKDIVIYGPAPYQILSLKSMELKIGLIQTSRGNTEHVNTALKWVEQALLNCGLGSRINAGYGCAGQVNNLFKSAAHIEYPFELWSQGIYGASTVRQEFRPTAVRGVLRYWFRAIALGLYLPATCKVLEQQIFGTIDPKAIHGSIQIQTAIDISSTSSNGGVHYIKGLIHMKSQNTTHLNLIQAILELIPYLGGIGRGSRRPIHWNSGVRGCYWQINKPPHILNNEHETWQDFLNRKSNSVKLAFQAMKAFDIPRIIKPKPSPKSQSLSNYRQQDILGQNSRIYIVKAPLLTHPRNITEWEVEGKTSTVRGPALELLYGNIEFKGGSLGRNVGGCLGTPSHIMIQSNFYNEEKDAYQTVTIFDVTHSDRQSFADALEKVEGAELVWQGW